jgi:uncharacterized protein YhfF
MRAFGLATPGPFRDELTALVLAGTKQATAGLLAVDYDPDDEEIEHVGERQVLLDSHDRPVAKLEVTRVEVHPFDRVPFEFAVAEGEGFTSVEDWQSGHRSFYAELGHEVRADEAVVCAWFRVIERVEPG